MRRRVEKIFAERVCSKNSLQNDKSTLKILAFFQSLLSKSNKVRHDDIKYGIELGLMYASLDGQIVELNTNIRDKRHKDFIDEFYALSAKYNCAIQYHFELGLVVVDMKSNLETFNE